jgi:hypothetical protein
MLTETLLKIPFSVVGRCSLVPTFHWRQGKCARIVTGGFLGFFRITGGFLFVFSVLKSPLQGLRSGLLPLEGFLKIVSNFKGAS